MRKRPDRKRKCSVSKDKSEQSKKSSKKVSARTSSEFTFVLVEGTKKVTQGKYFWPNEAKYVHLMRFLYDVVQCFCFHFRLQKLYRADLIQRAVVSEDDSRDNIQVVVKSAFAVHGIEDGPWRMLMKRTTGSGQKAFLTVFARSPNYRELTEYAVSLYIFPSLHECC